MPVLNDEVPDPDDFDADRPRGDFNMTPDDFIRSGSGSNPPGWLDKATIDDMRSKTPIPYVIVVPVHTDDLGRIRQVGTLLCANDGSDVALRRTLISGRVLYHESIREAITRNISKDLGDLTLASLPPTVQPFTVAQFFPTPGFSDYYDPRQHAIALCYIVPIAGEVEPQEETLDVEWTDASRALDPEFLSQLSYGMDHILVQALAGSGML